MNSRRSAVFIGMVIFFSVCLHAQVDLSNAISNVQTIAGQVAAVLGGLIGLLGIGRAAYKFAHGDGDAITSLIVGIVAYALGQVASAML